MNAPFMIEAEICELKQAARLAQKQLHFAIGELEYDCATGKCIEPPDAENAQLAVFTVNQVFDLAEKLEQRILDEISAGRSI